MTCEIIFNDRGIQLNNRQFENLINFTLEVAETSALNSETPYISHMKKMRDECFFPGRGIAIEEDFPDVLERKFWSRMFFNTSRAIFERKVGVHEHTYWQAQAIYQAYSTGLLFELAVREFEPQWSAETIDRQEFEKVVNGVKDNDRAAQNHQ